MTDTDPTDENVLRNIILKPFIIVGAILTFITSVVLLLDNYMSKTNLLTLFLSIGLVIAASIILNLCGHAKKLKSRLDESEHNRNILASTHEDLHRQVENLTADKYKLLHIIATLTANNSIHQLGQNHVEILTQIITEGIEDVG